MATKPQRLKRRDGPISSLNTAIETMNLTKEASSITPAKVVFGSVSILLTLVRVRYRLFSDSLFQVHIKLGLRSQQNRISRAWTSLR